MTELCGIRARRRRLAISLVALVFCGCAAGGVPQLPEGKAQTGSPLPAPAPKPELPPPEQVVAAVAAPGPDRFEQGPALKFSELRGKVTNQRAGNGIGGIAAADGRSMLINDKHARIVKPGSKPGAGVKLTPGAQMAVAPDGSRGAILHEGNMRRSVSGRYFTPYLLKVFNAANRIERSLQLDCPECLTTSVRFSRSSAPMAFASPTELVYNTRCQIKRLDLANKAAVPVEVGVSHCASAWDVSRDGSAWLASHKNARQNWSRQAFSSMVIVDGKTGTPTPLLMAESAVVPILEPRLSPRGDWVCFTRPPATCPTPGKQPPCIHGLTLSCSSVAKKNELTLATGEIHRGFAFSETGAVVAFMTIRGRDRIILLANFNTGLIQRLDVQPVAIANRVKFLRSDTRLVLYGIAGAIVYDLTTSTKQKITAREVGSVAGIPNNPLLVLLGLEVGGGRVLSWATLPAAPTP